MDFLRIKKAKIKLKKPYKINQFIQEYYKRYNILLGWNQAEKMMKGIKNDEEETQ